MGSFAGTWPHQLVAMPFPLDDGGMANLDLPARGLTRGEAERLKVYVDSLVAGLSGSSENAAFAHETHRRPVVGCAHCRREFGPPPYKAQT